MNKLTPIIVLLASLAHGCGPEAVLENGDTDVVDEDGCRLPWIVCDAVCINPNNDEQNCGSCGVTCEEGQVCASGGCVDECPDGLSMCSGVCVNTDTSSQHCGRCGHPCLTGQTCAGGVCVCAGELTDCSGLCVDTDKDDNNCGSCGNTCGNDEICQDGVCQAACAPPNEICDGACVDTTSSLEHCGECNHPCGRNQVCQGECVCAEDRDLCGSQCVDTNTSRDHCGDCFDACPEEAICRDGDCLCPPGRTRCGDQCVDLDTNAHFCGDCETDCGDDICVDGECAGGCPGTRELCGETCADLDNDPSHCGECFHPCRPDQDCLGGSCQCPAGFQECTSTCVNTDTNTNHCGGCGRPCADDEVCEGGECGCREGLTDCSGTCVDTAVDESHCGDCTTTCGELETCRASDCVCVEGYTRCGTECVQVQSDPDHCGECFEPCEGVCSGGECESSCTAPLVACDGACVDTSRDPNHCGDCVTECQAVESCVAGDCLCQNDIYEFEYSDELGGAREWSGNSCYGTPHCTDLRLCGEETDWYSIYVPSYFASLAVLLEGDCDAEILPILSVLDSSGTELAVEETGADCPFVWLDGLSIGMHTIRVENVFGAGAYDLTYQLSELYEEEPNDEPDTATGPFLGGTMEPFMVYAELAGSNDFDTYQFFVPRRGLVSFWTDDGFGSCETDTVLWVTDAAGDDLGEDDDGGTGLCSSLLLEVERGTYYVTVFGAFSDTSGFYALQSEFLHEVEAEPNGQTSSAEGPFAASFGVEATIFPPFDEDVYAIELPSTASLRAEVMGNRAGCMVDSQLELWTAGGELLGEDDDYDFNDALENQRGFGWCSRIDPSAASPDHSWAQDLPAGTYYLVVKGYDDSVGAYNLDVELLGL